VLLENVVVEMEVEDEELGAALEMVASIPIQKLAFDKPASAYIAYRKREGKASFPTGSFTATLKFISKDCDPDTGVADEEGYEDTYQVLIIGRLHSNP
jgi:coatomer protein complex subunit gamma